MPKLSSLGEFGLIARLQKILPPPVGKAWSVGIGDDTAVHSLGRGRSQLFTQDLLLEGIHFLPGTPRVWEDIGWKAMAVNLSDLAAMGGDPLGAVIGLGLPKRAKIPEIEALYRGIAQASRRFKCPVVGGDTNISKSGWVIAVAMLGETPRKPLLRSAARAGDSLWVTGELGGAALAWRAERKGKKIAQALRRRLVRPEPRLDWGRWLANLEKIGAAIDLSDGLAGDLKHLAAESGVGFDVELQRLPRPSGFAGLCRSLGTLEWNTLLTGGEDYELLFTLRPGGEAAFSTYCRRHRLRATRIGRARRDRGIRWLTPEGEINKSFHGFQHF